MKLDQTAAPEFHKFAVCVRKCCFPLILQPASKQGLPPLLQKFYLPHLFFKPLIIPPPSQREGGVASYG